MSFQDPHRITFTTADSVSFSLQLASPVLRAYALMIDICVLIGLQVLIGTVMQILKVLSFDTFQALHILLSFGVTLGYYMLLEWSWNGQTIGKRTVGIRVIDVQACRLAGSQVVLRTLFRAVDMIPYFYFLGTVVAFTNKRFQRLGDLVAGTMVVRTTKTTQPPVQDLPPVKFNSFRKFPRFEAQLRRETSPAEGECIVHALLRRDELDAEARLSLYQEMADQIRNRLRLPEGLETIGDEPFLRNCVDTLYRDLKVL